MKTHTITTYQFEELSESAKETARCWYREGALAYEWWDSCFEDAKRIGLEIEEFDLGRGQYAKGHLLGSMHDTVQAILAEHGRGTDTYQFAQRFYRDRHNGSSFEEEEFTRELLEEYRVMLDREYEWLMSDECIDESIEANEYEFSESGSFYG